MTRMSPLQYQLRNRLQHKGISARALEKRAGLKPSAVQNILQGKSKRPTALLLQAIARELNCSISELLGDSTVATQSSQWEEKASLDSKEGFAHEWNSKLYVEAIQIVEELLSQKKVEATKETVLKYADEIYRYSIESQSGKLDRYFATWLIDHYLIPRKK